MNSLPDSPPVRSEVAAPGFSLIEVLIVLSLTALLSSLAILTIASPPDLARSETDRLTRALLSARDQAILSNASVYVDFQEDGATFSVAVTDARSGSAGDKTTLEWDERVTVRIDGRRPPTRLVFDGLGLTDPTRLAIYAEGRSHILLLDGSGEILRNPS